MLYLTSFVGTYISEDQEVMKLYARLMISSVVFSLPLSPGVGYLIDRVNPRIIIPCAFSVRILAILLFSTVQDPTSYQSFTSGTFILFGTICEQICSDTLLMRNADKEIRGVIIGTATAAGYVGQIFLCLVGGWLFDSVGPAAPFYLTGLLDLVFALITIYLGVRGVIENDLAPKKKNPAGSGITENAIELK